MDVSVRARVALVIAIAAGMLSGAAATVPAIVIVLIARVFFDRIDPGLSVLQLVFTVIASVSVRLGLAIISRVAAGSAATLYSHRIRAAVTTALGALPLGELAAARPGAFESVLLDDAGAVAEFISERLTPIASAAGLLATGLAVLFVRDQQVTLTASGIALVAMALALPLGSRGRDRAAERASREALGGAIFGTVRTTELDRSLPAETFARSALPALASEYRRTTQRRAFAGATQAAIWRAFAGAFPVLLVFVALALGGAHAERSLLVLFAALGFRMTGAWIVAFSAGSASAPARAALQRIRAIVARPPFRGGNAAFPAGRDIRFREVTFGYPREAGGRGDVLHAVDVTLPAGAVTAIVGPSGSGKTTFTRLAARFWDVDRGAVEIGGVDVRELPLDTLMQNVTCVFQDVALLDDSVAVNLRLGRPEASDEDLVVAAKAAGAHDFIVALPSGYETLVGERGTRLSRGERQRLQIARAFLKDAPIVILDEPTASLDPATEAEITQALVPLLRGKTVLVVAHRLATIVDADRIVVLDRTGAVEAQGTHAELLEISPTYARMWRSHSGAEQHAPPSTNGAAHASASSPSPEGVAT